MRICAYRNTRICDYINTRILNYMNMRIDVYLEYRHSYVYVIYRYINIDILAIFGYINRKIYRYFMNCLYTLYILITFAY